MNQSKTIDPFEIWKNVYDQTESYWSKVLDENLATEDFSRGLGKVLDMNLQYRKLVNDSTKTYLEQMNMPSKDDLAKLASLIINVESKVDQIEEVVEERIVVQADAQAVASEVKELQIEVKNLHNKMDQILLLLQKKK
ncbi:MAG TPA: polyhydroxyalkanoic acid synthase subunit PhaR [Bacillus bacterium]|nr:polyhydroxyalkanoic acid synthase subunit PhaR [Bacillus sp. (in: firmicutes)]